MLPQLGVTLEVLQDDLVYPRPVVRSSVAVIGNCDGGNLVSLHHCHRLIPMANPDLIDAVVGYCYCSMADSRLLIDDFAVRSMAAPI